MAATANLYRWEELEQDHPMEKLDRKRIIGERVMLSDVLLHRGCFVPMHAHENEQFAMVMSGSIRFQIGAEGKEQKEIVLCGGEVLHLPSNVPHAAVALEDTHVIDVFSPISQGTGIDEVGRRS